MIILKDNFLKHLNNKEYQKHLNDAFIQIPIWIPFLHKIKTSNLNRITEY